MTIRWIAAVTFAVIVLIGLSLGYARRAGPGPRVVVIAAKDLAFEPPRISIGSGTTTIVLRNDGQQPHNLVLSGPDGTDIGGIPTAATFLSPGASGQKTFRLSPGAYAFYCSRDSHYQLGMAGILNVR